MSGVYHANLVATSVSVAKTLIQLKAGAACVCHILRAVITQTASTTSTMQRVQLIRTATAATVTSFTPVPMHPGDTSTSIGGASATGVNATAEGGTPSVVLEESFNILNGFFYIPLPEERILVPPGAFLSLALPAAPAAALTISARLVWQEIT